MEGEIITEKTVSPLFQRVVNARGWVDHRAYDVQQELARVSSSRSIFFWFY